MVSTQTPVRSSPADSSPAYERAAPLWHGKSLWYGIVLRRQLLLQTQKRKAADLRTPTSTVSDPIMRSSRSLR
jgi:hypothetical protein